LNNDALYEIEIVSSPGFEKSYCEVRVGLYGIMVSEDVPDRFMVTVCSLFPAADKMFYEGISTIDCQIEAGTLLNIVQRCVEALKRLNSSS
jgi:hypothetical protein